MQINDSRELFANGKQLDSNTAPIIVADRLKTPENIGNIIRLAANIGASKLISIEDVQLKDNRIKKTACMAWNYVELIHTSYEEFAQYIPSDYLWTALETSAKSQNIYSTDLPQRMALFVGNEVWGIRQELLDRCPLHVNIPMTGPATSMNVSHATAVALFEWQRRVL